MSFLALEFEILDHDDLHLVKIMIFAPASTAIANQYDKITIVLSLWLHGNRYYKNSMKITSLKKMSKIVGLQTFNSKTDLYIILLT